MSDVELIEFKEDSIVVTVFMDDPEAFEELKDIWMNKVESIQAPLVGSYKNMFTVSIPWILKEDTIDE